MQVTISQRWEEQLLIIKNSKNSMALKIVEVWSISMHSRQGTNLCFFPILVCLVQIWEASRRCLHIYLHYEGSGSGSCPRIWAELIRLLLGGCGANNSRHKNTFLFSFLGPVWWRWNLIGFRIGWGKKKNFNSSWVEFQVLRSISDPFTGLHWRLFAFLCWMWLFFMGKSWMWHY